MRPIFVLDACSLIAFFNDETGADVVEKLLVKAWQNDIELIISIINLLEIYYGIYREDGSDMADRTLQKIKSLPITIINTVSDEVFHESAQLKAAYRISLADAIALAEATVRAAHIVTADHHEFDILEKQSKVKILWIR